MREWQANLSASALIVWDLQYGIAMKAFNFPEMIANIKSIIDVMHSLQRPVIFTQSTGLPYEYQSKYTIYRLRKRGVDPKATPQMLEGSHEWQLMEDLKPAKSDLIIKKFTPSLFVGTAAEQVLKNKDVDSVVLTGVSTEFGVETTARHAACLGLVPVIVEDAVGSGDLQSHNSALEVMRKLFEVKRTDSIVQTLKSNSS
ncbi:MAG: cysteine hydrolase [Thaumarchaeota archaeon]|nr:cysteine hydrolase [Nitrososphaerota archaeon]